MVDRTQIFRDLISPRLTSVLISVNFVWIWIEIYERNDSVNKQVAAL